MGDHGHPDGRVRECAQVFAGALAVRQPDRIVPAHSGTAGEDAGQYRRLPMHAGSLGRTESQRQADRFAGGDCQSVLHVQSARDSLVGPRVDGRQRNPGRLQRRAPLRGCRGDLFVRRHVPDANPNRGQSDHRFQCIGVTENVESFVGAALCGRPSRERRQGDEMSSPVAATEFENLLYEKKNSIAYVTLNRPKVLNALNHATWNDLHAAFEDARDDETVHGVILTGAGDKAFIAGADISELATVSAVQAEEGSRYGQQVLDLVENLGKPVIAAINGFALGGGCETAMACTIRLATETARVGQPEVKLGVIAGGGGTQRLPRLVGKGRALQLLLTAGMIDAQEAYRIGLGNEVVPPANLTTRAEEILKQIFANAPLGVKYSIEAVNKGMDTTQA